MQLLLAYVQTPRYEGPEVDRYMVEKDAKALYKAGERRLGTDEKTFIKIFTERSRPHLAAVSYAYHHTYGNSLKKVNYNSSSHHIKKNPNIIIACSNKFRLVAAGSEERNVGEF